MGNGDLDRGKQFYISVDGLGWLSTTKARHPKIYGLNAKRKVKVTKRKIQIENVRGINNLK